MKIYSCFDITLHETLRGNFKTIANRYGVSSRYISLVSNSEREIKSKKSIAIYIDLLNLIKVLQPVRYMSYLRNLPDSNIMIIAENSKSTHMDYLVLISKK